MDKKLWLEVHDGVTYRTNGRLRQKVDDHELLRLQYLRARMDDAIQEMTRLGLVMLGMVGGVGISREHWPMVIIGVVGSVVLLLWSEMIRRKRRSS